jgi:heme oxygenase
MNMKLQIIQDSEGKATGVYIPIREWKELKKQYKDLEALEYEEPTKEQILQEIKEAVNELKLVEQGKLKARPAKELLDEL